MNCGIWIHKYVPRWDNMHWFPHAEPVQPNDRHADLYVNQNPKWLIVTDESCIIFITSHVIL